VITFKDAHEFQWHLIFLSPWYRYTWVGCLLLHWSPAWVIEVRHVVKGFRIVNVNWNIISRQPCYLGKRLYLGCWPISQKATLLSWVLVWEWCMYFREPGCTSFKSLLDCYTVRLGPQALEGLMGHRALHTSNLPCAQSAKFCQHAFISFQIHSLHTIIHCCPHGKNLLYPGLQRNSTHAH